MKPAVGVQMMWLARNSGQCGRLSSIALNGRKCEEIYPATVGSGNVTASSRAQPVQLGLLKSTNSSLRSALALARAESRSRSQAMVSSGCTMPALYHIGTED